MNTVHAKGNVLNKIGIPSHMVWGYIGVVIFMVGDASNKAGCLLFSLIMVSVCSNPHRYLPCTALLSPSQLGFEERLSKLRGQEKR